MTEIRVAESSDGVNHLITVYQEGSITPENLTGYTGATMTVKSIDLLTTIATITLAITDAANGVITYTTAVAHALPAVTTGLKAEYRYQIKITGTNLKDITKIDTFIIDNDISN